MSYHKLKIHKHDVTSPYKIQEEFMEYLDALCAKNRVMAVQELSDLYCAIENEAIKNGFTMQELKIMADTTKNVFRCGYRKSATLLDYTVVDSITYTEGDVYFRDCDTFHSVGAEHGTISKVTKYGLKHNAYIITDKLDIPFEQLPKSELWRIVGDVINEK